MLKTETTIIIVLSVLTGVFLCLLIATTFERREQQQKIMMLEQVIEDSTSDPKAQKEKCYSIEETFKYTSDKCKQEANFYTTYEGSIRLPASYETEIFYLCMLNVDARRN